MMFALVVSSVGAIGGVEVAEAAEETTVSVWSESVELYNWSSFDFNYNYNQYVSISKFSITYQLTDSSTIGAFILNCNNENIGGSYSINSSGTIDLEFPAEMLSTIKNNGNLEIGGINITVTDISVTGVLYDEDAWTEDSGTYTYYATTDGSNPSSLVFRISDITSSDSSKITSISFESSFESTGTVEFTNANDQWVSHDGIAKGTNTIETDGIKPGDFIYIKADYLAVGTNTISDIKVTLSGTGDYEANTLYTQTVIVTNTYSQRWVYLVSEADLAKYQNATFTITRGDSKKMTKTVSTVYKYIMAEGETLSYDGYYWICYSLQEVPSDVKLTGEISLTPVE